MRRAAPAGVDTQQQEQEDDRELVVLEAWRARLCARGLRDAYDRMRRAMLGGHLELSQALQIAGAMDAAIDMLRATTKRLAPGTEVRAAAEDVMTAFIEWRVASPRTDASRRASARFGARVLALEEAATRASRPEPAAPPGAPATSESEPRAAEEVRAEPSAESVETDAPTAAAPLEEPGSFPVITIEATSLDLDDLEEEGPSDAAPAEPPPRIPRDRKPSARSTPSQRRRGRPRDRT